MVREVSFNEFVARLGPEDRRAVQDALNSGMGMANYHGLVLSYGRRGAAIETTFPPAAYGSAELGDFVSPIPNPATKRSPLLDGVAGGVPQIARPRVAPSHTEYPDVQIETRTSRHPRGDSGGFIDAQRFTPGREQEEVPQAPLSEEAAWWRDRL